MSLFHHPGNGNFVAQTLYATVRIEAYLQTENSFFSNKIPKLDSRFSSSGHLVGEDDTAYVEPILFVGVGNM